MLYDKKYYIDNKLTVTVEEMPDDGLKRMSMYTGTVYDPDANELLHIWDDKLIIPSKSDIQELPQQYKDAWRKFTDKIRTAKPNQ